MTQAVTGSCHTCHTCHTCHSSELNDQAVLSATKGRLARVGSLAVEAMKAMEATEAMEAPARRVLDKAVLWRSGGTGRAGRGLFVFLGSQAMVKPREEVRSHAC